MKLQQILRAAPTVESLRKWNIWLAGLYGLQAVAILLLSATRTFPISMSYLTTDSLQSTTSGSLVLAPAMHHLFDLNLAYLVAAFLLIAALTHASMATWYRRRYEADLAGRTNHFRWLQYCLSASLMLVALGVVSGMYDFVSLLLLFGIGVVMHVIFLIVERTSQGRGRAAGVNVFGYLVGFATGCLAWLGIVLYVLAAAVFGSGHLPGYVYAAVISLIVICAGLAANLWLQLQRRGPWKNYLYGERWFMVLSCAAMTALAWQLFAGALHP